MPGYVAPMVKLVDTADLKSAAARRAGSIPARSTILKNIRMNQIVSHMLNTRMPSRQSGVWLMFARLNESYPIAGF